MSEQVEIFAALKDQRQARHAAWKVQNLEIFKQSGIPFSERPEALLVRVHGMPKVDFYPSTGRWRVLDGGRAVNRTMSGGARAFVAWWKRQQKERERTNGSP